MGVKEFEIKFSKKRSPVFVAGETMEGNVIIELDKPTKARGVVIRFYGAAQVYWSEKIKEKTKKLFVQKHFKNQEIYFDQRDLLWGNGDGGGPLDDGPNHPTGKHVYPFKFHLPADIPSSFEGQFGRVRYYVECVIDRPWKFDHKAKVPFSVNSIYDLNENSSARNPRRKQAMQKLCCLCCKSGPMTNSLHVERCGFVPGEIITVKGEVDNQSSRKITSTALQLRQVTTYITTKKTRSSTKNIVHFRRGELDKGESEVWSGERIHIPPLPPSDLIYCSIIDIKYYVALVSIPSGPAQELEAPIKVYIGTVPLTDVEHIYANATLPEVPKSLIPSSDGMQQEKAKPRRGSDRKSPPPVYTETQASNGYTDETPAPTYAKGIEEENIDIREEDDEFTFGDLSYVPQYTYYSWAWTRAINAMRAQMKLTNMLKN